MSQFESEAAAAEALAAAVQGDAGSEQAAAAAETPLVDPGATTPDTPSSIDLSTLDPATLPADVQELAKSLQGDYTRKTQEIASYREALKEFDLQPDQAREALAFVQALNDPENLQALYQRLNTEFGETPVSPGEFGLEGEGVDPRDQQLSALSQRIEQMEQRAVRAEVTAQIERQEAQLLSEGFKEEQLPDVARFALSHGGDLIKGAADFRAFEQKVLGAYAASKATVPAGASAPAATGHAETPTKFENTDQAHEAALRAYIAAINS